MGFDSLVSGIFMCNGIYIIYPNYGYIVGSYKINMEINGINKNEIKILQKWGYQNYNEDIKFSRNKKLKEFIFIVSDCRYKHDSGYPFIRVLGVIKGTKNLFNLGWHDHIDLRQGNLNVDSLGKNVFRLFCHETLKVCDYFWSCSSLVIENGVVL